MSTEQIMTELHKTFSQSQVSLVQPRLTKLINTSHTLEELVAKVYEVINVATEENQVAVNKKINRLDTRKDKL